MLRNKKILIILIAFIILVGAVIGCIKGFNYDEYYSKKTKVFLSLDTEYNIEDIKQIVSETFVNKKNVITESDFIEITLSEVSEEEKQTLIEKINTKYNVDLTSENVETVVLPQTRAIDIVKQYILPIILTTIISAIYYAILYRKQNTLKVLEIVFGIIFGVLGVYFAIYSIARIPISRITMPLALALFIASLAIISVILKKKNK